MSIQFVGKYTGYGKKIRGNQPRVFLHGMRFHIQKKTILTKEFIEEAGLNDIAIRDQAIATIRELYGIAITYYESRYKDDEPGSEIAQVSGNKQLETGQATPTGENDAEATGGAYKENSDASEDQIEA